MIYTQHFLVDGRHLGTASRKPKACHERLSPPESCAFFCPVCAEVWARCPVTDPLGNQPEDFVVWRITCSKHANKQLAQVPGSLFLCWDKPFNDSFPDDVVKREFEVHLTYAESRL